jgi:wobble nucleotide-excising tRNase
MAADITLKIQAKNLGPHENLDFSEKVNSLKTVIYANNGNGKTFISRAFRQVAVPETLKSNRLISFSQTKANFNFEINRPTDAVNPNRKIELVVEKDKEIIANNESGYILHVFNNDYVQENIEKLGYKPDGNIEGYILGKDVIDLTAEKGELETKKATIESKKQVFQTKISAHKRELDALAIKSNTVEYQFFTSDNIYQNKEIQSEDSNFDELKKQNTVLNTLPDDFPNVLSITSDINIEFIDNVLEILSIKHDKGHFSEEFKQKIRDKQDLIELGLKYIQSSACPFCEQTLTDTAIKLIDEYTKYLADNEAQIIGSISRQIKQLELLEKQFKDTINSYLKSKVSYDKLKGYLPSFSDKSLTEIVIPETLSGLKQQLVKLLEEKKIDITRSWDSDLLTKIKKEITAIFNQTTKLVSESNKLINQINTKKDNLGREKLELKKRLCRAKYIIAAKETNVLVAEIKQGQTEIVSLETQIAEKENRVKALKKDKVASTFEHFLNEFFAGKYQFNRNSFCLKFKTNDLIENASDVLSEGEKSIVAFCFYLAETHTKVSTENEYNDLFFIIDDPISSLDFHYVYSVAQIIRTVSSYFSIQRQRLLVLTHNLEFMSILIRNKIMDNKFVLDGKSMKKIKDELIMPYESHLRDIFNVSSRISSPSHTTPNSIRHVLETINKFESPKMDFHDYVQNIGEFNGCAYIYSLIHDYSHGNIRQQKPVTEDMIIDACSKVIAFIAAKFSGQVEALNT